MTHFKEIVAAIGIALTSLIAPVLPILLTVGFLIFTDTVFGLAKAKATGEPITSRKLGNIISKMLLYNLAIMSLFLLETYVFGWTGMQLTKAGAVAIAITEVLSIDESFKKIFGYSIWSKVKSHIKRGISETK